MNKAEYLRVINSLSIYDMGVNCHIIENHIGLSDEDLMARSRAEKIDATVFTKEREEVAKLIRECLLDSYATKTILSWVDDLSKPDILDNIAFYEENIGKGFMFKGHDWREGAKFTDCVKIVIKRVYRQKDCSFKIITSYPYFKE